MDRSGFPLRLHPAVPTFYTFIVSINLMTIFYLTLLTSLLLNGAAFYWLVSKNKSVGAVHSAPDSTPVALCQPAQTTTAAAPPRISRDAIILNLQSGILAVNEAGQTLAVNPAAERLLGLDPGALDGRSIADFIGTRLLYNLAKEAIRSGQIGTAEMIIGGSDERTLEAAATKFQDPLVGHGAIVMLNDVTQLRQLETLRRDFVANVSHELKTPVASIQGFTETLLDGAIDDHSVRAHFLEIILHQSKRLRSIIDDLLKLACLESPGQNLQLHRQTVRAADLLEAVRAITIERAQQKGIKLTVDCAYELLLWVNQSLVEQCLLNLVDNAIKYCPAGAQIVIFARKTDDGAELAVADTGSGISAEHLPRLFERFYRVDKGRSRDEGGSGLGLAIVKHIALAHGGTVSVESTPGEGSIFKIHLSESSISRSDSAVKKAV